MLNIFDPNLLKIVKGNSAEISIVMVDPKTGLPYDIASADKVLFTVKKNHYDKTPIIQKELTILDVGEDDHTLILNLNPKDTMIITGEYMYDVLLVTGDNRAITFISSNLIIEPAAGLYTDVCPDPEAYELFIDADGLSFYGSDGAIFTCRKENN